MGTGELHTEFCFETCVEVGRTILKWIFKRDGETWTGLIWLRRDNAEMNL
jgi:hypothetical protein